MAVSKVILNGTTLIDVTEDTVAADKLLKGFIATKNDGAKITGTYEDSGGGSGDGDVLVRFIDYDGTELHSYTVDEFNALNALPANPSHTGLTAQGWNWTLEQAKAQLEAMPEAGLTIGQMYVTDDGKTRIYCHFEAPRLSPYLCIGLNGTVVVDWGDGSSTDTLTGSSLNTLASIQHIYTDTGDYTITLTVTSGKFTISGSNNYSSYLLRKGTGSTSSNLSAIYRNGIRAIEIGEDCSIGIYAFQNCYSLTSLTIPSGVTSIGNYAFNGCYSLTSLTIPSGVTSIGTTAFQYCYSLTSLTIPSGVTSIGTNAFQNCYSLTSLTIPSGVTSIGNYAFNGCYSLTSLTIPSGVTSIGTNAFQNCYSLTSLTIPSGVTSIGDYAFRYCYSLTSLTIPSGVTSIGDYAFGSCYSLTSLTIPSGVTSIGIYAFQNCYSLTSLTIPSGVTSIGNYTFSACYCLTSLTIPSGVTSIGTYVFQNCYSLTSLTIPSGVTSIGNYTFSACWSLASLTIPSGVTSIGNYAFQNCYGLSELHFQSDTPPTVNNSNAFTNVPTDCTIYVPTGSLEAYTTATNYPSSSTYTYVEE